MLDLRSFLASHPGRVRTIGEPLRTDQEITALQHVLQDEIEQPVLLIEKPLLDDGRGSDRSRSSRTYVPTVA